MVAVLTEGVADSQVLALRQIALVLRLAYLPAQLVQGLVQVVIRLRHQFGNVEVG